jgi:hypothetical protein
LGWSEAYSARRFGDSTHVFHAMIAEKHGDLTVLRPACNPKRRTYGLMEKAATRGHRCGACAKIATKRALA